MATSEHHHDELTRLVATCPDVVTAYLFGSALTSDSPGDLDVAVVFTDGTDRLESALALQARLEASLDRPVDLHELQRLPLDLQFRIVQRGRVLVDRDPTRRLRDEIVVFDAFNDFRPYLDRIRAGSRRRLLADVDGG